MVPWVLFAFVRVYHESYKFEQLAVRNLVLGNLNFTIPTIISTFSAKLWLSRRSFSDHHDLSDNTEDTWSFSQVVLLVLMPNAFISFLQSWNSKRLVSLALLLNYIRLIRLCTHRKRRYYTATKQF